VITNAPAIKEPKRLALKFNKFKRLYYSRLDLTPSQIAAKVYDCQDDKSASTIACQNLKKLGIGRSEVLERLGLTDEADAADLARLRKAKKVVSAIFTGSEAGAADKDFIEVEDNGTQLKALELTFKVKGAFSDEKQGPGDHINNFLTIVENVNVANIQAPKKGIEIERSQSPDFNKYLAK